MMMSVALPFFWQSPDGATIGLFALMGLVSDLGSFLPIRAYDHAPVSVLALFTYLEIVSATLHGYVIFGDLPETRPWAGVSVIILSGSFIAYRDRKLE